MPEEHKIVPRDKVQHGSGGQIMVVLNVDGENARCQWVFRNLKLEETFPLIALDWIDPSKSPI